MPKRAVSDKKISKEERARLKAAEQQRNYRKATGYSYDKAYKKAQDAAMRRLAKEVPNRYRRLFNEEREKVGLGPVQKRG